MSAPLESAPLTIGLVRVNNVMGIKAVELDASGLPVVTVTGRNAQGKSSLLMAIVMALGGKRAMVEEALRLGTKKGEIVVNVGKYRIRRTITPKDSYLTITVNGEELPKGQTAQQLLNELCGVFFEPMAWLAKPPKEQVQLLQDISGLDFTAHDAERKRLFDQRTDANRDAKRLRALAESLPTFPGAPEERVDLGDLVKELDEVRAVNQRNADIRAEAKAAAGALEQAQARHAELKLELAKAAKAMKDAHVTNSEAQAAVIDCHDEDEAPIREQMTTAGETNRQIEMNERAATALDEAEDAANRSLKLTQKLADMDESKAEQLAASKLPVAGLSYTADGVTYKAPGADGAVPLKQVSQAQGIKIACMLAFERQTQTSDGERLFVIFIRDASLLDDQSHATIHAIVMRYQAQVFMEIVNSKDPAAIRIEDGLQGDQEAWLKENESSLRDDE